MYLFSELQITPLVLLFLLWGLGGWLMTLRWFDLEIHERGLIGFGLGLVISNWLGNFLARFTPMSVAFWLAALLTLALGLFAAWPLNRGLLGEPQKIRWSIWILFILAAFVFTLIRRGLGMLDSASFAGGTGCTLWLSLLSLFAWRSVHTHGLRATLDCL
jgi:hypothetical protein